MRKLLGWGIAVIFDVFAAFIIYRLIQPFTSWYLSQKPAVGVDLFNSITYVAYHLKHFAFPWSGFKDIWYGGYPLMRDFPQAAFYAMLPAANLLGPGLGVQMTAMVSFFLFLFFCYLLFSRLSKNFGIAIVLTSFVFLSVNIYGALTWAGSIPSFISQLFFPLLLYVGAKYLEKAEVKHVALCALLTAVGLLFHPLEVIAFVVPATLILILFGRVYHWTNVMTLVGHLFLYLLGFFFGAFVFTYDIFISLVTRGLLPGIIDTSNSGVVQEVNPGAVAIANFYKSQIASLYTQTHQGMFIALFAALGLFFVGLLLARKRKVALYTLPFIFIVGYTALHPTLNFLGYINIFRHDPYRAFWPFPVALGALVASLAGLFFRGLVERLHQNKWLSKLSVAHAIGIGVSMVLLAITLQIVREDTQKALSSISEKIEYSSAFPEALSLSFTKEYTSKLKNQLAPSFMDPNDKNKRLYAVDASVNIWWNSYFDLPLVRGYIDPPVGLTLRGGLFWLDVAIANDTIVREFGIPENQALQNALFLIDWNAIHYFEGGRLGSKGSNAPPSSYLLNNSIFDPPEDVTTYGAVLKTQTVSGKHELHMEVPQILKFYKVKDEYTSPVLSATNATPILVISDFAGYEDILRLLGAHNLNSQKIIPVFGDKYVDRYSEEQLEAFDAVILHQYTYGNRSKAYRTLEAYVKNGGNVFVDTGSETPDANSRNVPEPLPVSETIREGKGNKWYLAGEHEIVSTLDLNEFGPLVFNNEAWKLSLPESDQSLRENSEIYLTHSGVPLIVARSYGQGKIIWSGMNLPYHFNQYHKDVEVVLFEKLLGSLVKLEPTETIQSKIEWIRPEKVKITPQTAARGILFKQERYPGWSVYKDGVSGKLPLYVAGPTYPGFMYVPLSDTESGTFEFRYTTQNLFMVVLIVNCIVLILLLDIAAFGGKFFLKRLAFVRKLAAKYMGSWWDKEEE